MIKWNVGMKIGTGFALALAILVVIGSIAHRSIVQLTDTAGWVDHTQQVLAKLESVISTVKDAETGQRGYILTGDEKYLEPFRSAQSAIAGELKTLREFTKDNPGQQRRLDSLENLVTGRDGKFAAMNETIDARKGAGGFDAALQIVRTDKGRQLMEDIRKLIAEMKDEEGSLLGLRNEAAAASALNARIAITGGTIGAIVILAIVGFLITRNISHPLGEITRAAERIAQGDLSIVMASTDREDEIGILTRMFSRMTETLKGMSGVAEKIASGDLRSKTRPQSEKDVLGTSFALMVENLQKLTADLSEGVSVLGTSATEISSSTTQLAASASQSAAAVSETTTTVEEVRQTAQLASQKARDVSDTAQKAAQISLSGRKSIEDVGTGMNRIRQQMDAIASSMGRLSEQSQTIGQIIATVEDLAAQSNLLAVNAAIEAAKAGEHGKGFGVVAQEVKSLAEQSRQATNQVRTILSEVQKATTAAVLATEQGSKAVDAGTRQSETAGESILALTDSVSEAAQAATQIAASSQQQLVGVDQVAMAMENIKQASVQNVASAKQLESAAYNLKDLGQRLKQLVAKYQV